MRPLATLPKAHLHLHLEGAMRPETLRELATGYGMEVPVIRGYGSFPAFAEMYLAACAVIQKPEDLARLVHEVVTDAAAAGATWVEPSFYGPYHHEVFGSEEAVIEAVLAAGREAAESTGIGVGFMLAADRTLDPRIAVERARVAAVYVGQGVVSFGLANDEGPHPPEPFAEAFRIARDAGLISTPHAGELAGPESVRGALDALGARRIQHGVRAVEDPALVERLADEQVCLDVCPTSNLMLGVVDNLDDHPLPALLEAGVACSLNGDDPLLFGPGLLDEYTLCRDRLGFDDETLARLARASIEHSGAPGELKAESLAGIEAWLATNPGA